MKVTISPPATIALRTLGEEDRRRVTAWLAHLENWESDEFVRSHSQKLPSEQNVYVLRTSSDILLFFRLDGEAIQVFDIARKSALQRFDQAPEQAHR